MTESTNKKEISDEKMSVTTDISIDNHFQENEATTLSSNTVTCTESINEHTSNDCYVEKINKHQERNENNDIASKNPNESLVSCNKNECCQDNECSHSKQQTVQADECSEDLNICKNNSKQNIETSAQTTPLPEELYLDSLSDCQNAEQTLEIDKNEAPTSLLNDCKFSSSGESLSYSDTPLSHIHRKKEVCDNVEGNNHCNLNSVSQFSEDDVDSLSEQDSENEYGQAEFFLPLSLESDPPLLKTNEVGVRRSRPTFDYYEANIKFLEHNNKKLLLELTDAKSKLNVQENEYKKCQVLSKNEFESKIAKLSQLCESLKKDKEAMVIRYANSEKEVILTKKLQTDFEKKLKDAIKDRDNLSNKIKNYFVERQRLFSNLDQKSSELAALQKDYERQKEDISCKEIKIKWIQNKLKTEIDSHKETQAKLDHNIQRLQEKREEAEQVRKDCQEMIRRYQEAEEIKSVKLDHQLRQKLSELEVQKQERSDQEEVYDLLRQELEALKKKQRITIEENNNLTLKIHGLEKERLEYEQTLSKLKDSQNSLKQELVDLTGRIAEMQNLGLQLQREKEKVSASAREVDRLRQTNAELQADMDACHMKEGELLEFTERLTAKTVHLQSEHSLLESKAQALEEVVTQLNKKNSEMEQKIDDLVTSLEEEQKHRYEETQLLARKLAEKTKNVKLLTVKLEESDNENRVMKRRHIASIKELSRELYQWKKKLEAFETSISHGDATNLSSRASSSASLEMVASVNSTPVADPSASTQQTSPQVMFSGGKSINSAQNTICIPQEVDKQMLIERIVKLQKLLAKKNDKIEFLEDHNGQLVKEMKKKSKIIQSYIIKEQTGALTSTKSDQNKLDLTKRGGIMASVYSSNLSDNNMTLELSLEINQKLQAVLEDTLLKNITLKENINTLGEEIARLTTEKREVSRQLIKYKSTN